MCGQNLLQRNSSHWYEWYTEKNRKRKMCRGQTTLGQKSEKIKARTEITALKDSGHLPSQYFHVPNSHSNSDLELKTIHFQWCCLTAPTIPVFMEKGIVWLKEKQPTSFESVPMVSCSEETCAKNYKRNEKIFKDIISKSQSRNKQLFNDAVMRNWQAWLDQQRLQWV